MYCGTTTRTCRSGLMRGMNRYSLPWLWLYIEYFSFSGNTNALGDLDMSMVEPVFMGCDARGVGSYLTG